MSKLPFLKLLIPFTLGIFAAIYLQFDWLFSISLAIGSFLLAWFIEYICNRRLKPLPYILLTLFFILGSFFLGTLRLETYKDINRSNHFTHLDGDRIEVLVNDVVEKKIGNYRFKGKIISVADSSQVFSATGNALIYWDTASELVPEYGKSYWLHSNFIGIPAPKNPDEFNYKEYLTYYNIYFKSYVRSGDKVISSKRSVTLVNSLVFKLRDWSRNKLKFYLPNNRTFLVAQALILGGKNNLDETTKSYFAQTGTLHVLAVSGLHVGIIFLILGWLTNPLKIHKHGKWLRILLMLLGIWLYALVTGFSPSVQRASIMFTVFSLADLVKGKTIGLNSLFASAFIMLVYNPFLIVNVGFQLSYAAVLGILLIYPPLYQTFSFSRIKNKAVHWVIDKAWSIITISIAAQLATFPVSMFYFGQFPSYFMFSNLVVIPAVFLLVCLALSILVFSPFVVLAKLVALAFDGIARLVLFLVEKVAHLPYAFASGLHLSFGQAIWLYLILSFLILFLHHKKWKWLNGALTLLAIFLVVVNVNWVVSHGQSRAVLHSIRNAQVVSFLKGNKAFVIADSSFLNNKSAQKFHLAPYFRKNYIKDIEFVELKGSLAGVLPQQDSVKILYHKTKYPNAKLLDSLKRKYFLTLNHNRYTDTLFEKGDKIIWTSKSSYLHNPSNAFSSLDSFAQFIKN